MGKRGKPRLEVHLPRYKTWFTTSLTPSITLIIRLTIIAKHSLSGFTDVFVKDFHTKDAITSKKFKSGDSLEVINI